MTTLIKISLFVLLSIISFAFFIQYPFYIKESITFADFAWMSSSFGLFCLSVRGLIEESLCNP